MLKGRIRINRARAFFSPGAHLALALAGALGIAAIAAVPARSAEEALVGIHIYSPAKTILEKLGNPSQVLPGAQSITSAGGGSGYGGAPGMGGRMGMGGRGGMGGSPFGPAGGMGGPPGGVAPLPQMSMGGAPGGMPGEFGPPGMGGDAAAGAFGGPRGMMGGRPGMMGGPPGMMGGGAGRFGGAPMGPYGPGAGYGNNGQGGDETYQNQEVWYIYSKPNDITYEFLLSPKGRTIEMAAAGYKGGATTSRGIVLGSAYKDVLAKYGFPESQSVQNGVVFLSYSHRAHVAFQLMNNKVISIIVVYMQ